MRFTTQTIAIVTAILLCTSCATIPSANMSGPKTIILNGESYSENETVKFTSWRCVDYVSPSGTLVELGTFSKQEMQNLGYILYDGSNSGEATLYQRKGINHRWDWGPNGGDYAFVIKPDGTGLFYDFTSADAGESIKANEVYKCRQ